MKMIYDISFEIKRYDTIDGLLQFISIIKAYFYGIWQYKVPNT